jgi:O-antigen ligase
MFIVGLYTGKAIMSMASTAMVVHAILEFRARGVQSAIFKHHLIKAPIILFATYVISGFWSTNLPNYFASVWLHTPLIIFPCALLFTRCLSLQEIEKLLTLFIICAVAGALFTLYHFMLNFDNIIDAYHYGKTMRTPFKSDHIRFGMAVALSILFCAELCFNAKHKKSIVLFALIGIFLLVFVHILSGKMAIVCSYLVCASVVLRLFVSGKKKLRVLSLTMLACIMVAPFVAKKFSPTFEQKWQYFMYSLEQLAKPSLDANISDAGRVVSYQVAQKIITKNIVFGVGAGDVHDAVTQGYKEKFINNQQVKVMMPHNQFLMQALIAGIVGVLALLYLLIAPFFHKPLRHWLLVTFSLVVLVGLFFEPMLEVQYGVAIHIFFLLLLAKYLAVKASVRHD